MWDDWRVEAWPSLPLLVVGLIGTEAAGAMQPAAASPVDALAYTLVVLAAGALAVRSHPGGVLAVNGMAVSAYLASGYPFGPILLTVPVAMYYAALAWPLGRAAVAVAADFGMIVVALFRKVFGESADVDPNHVFVWAAIALGALAVGVSVRARREAVAGLRSEQARRVASEERLRMAQELHDSIGHGLAAIAMQAGVALHVLDRDASGARHAMEAVRATSRESLDNLRAELERLRGTEPARHHPDPGLDDLEALAGRVRAAGIELTLDVQPGLDLDGRLDAAAFRIVRESLTNVLRHAGARTARVAVRRDGPYLLVEVTDTGSGGVPAEPKLGVQGMRDQAERLGGTLRAGPAPGGGFEVRARVPLGSRS